MLKEQVKFSESTVLEGMVSIQAVLHGREAGVNDREIEQILFDAARLGKIGREVSYLRRMCERADIPLVPTDAATIDALALGTSHGGILARCTERRLPSLSAAVSDGRIEPNGFYAMIEGIEDPYNFGYAIRSLYACGCSGILASRRNWFHAAGVVARSSAGASELMPVFSTDDPTETVDVFHGLGYRIVCADERTENVLGRTALPCPLLLIVGGEKRGITRSLLERADLRVRIAYARPFRASLSAASAATMFAYEIARQRDAGNI